MWTDTENLHNHKTQLLHKRVSLHDFKRGTKRKEEESIECAFLVHSCLTNGGAAAWNGMRDMLTSDCCYISLPLLLLESCWQYDYIIWPKVLPRRKHFRNDAGWLFMSKSLQLCLYGPAVSFQKEFELAWDVICPGQSCISDGG